MSTFLLIDAMNLFFRCRYITQGDTGTKSALALHLILNSIRKVWRDFKGDHVVVCLDGKSWRREIYPDYKKHRQVQAELRTPKEKEDDETYLEILNEFVKFLQQRSNVTILQAPLVEADDWIARWVQLHKNDKHIIISSDSDFFQLIAENVSIYDGIKQHLIELRNVLDDKGNVVVDKKTNAPMIPPNPEWELFSKIMRGDPGDNIMSAYPGVRDKSSKKKTGLIDAFEDRKAKGYLWNNLFLSTWVDHEGKEHRVLDCYELNRKLIDLTCQPDEIKELMDKIIINEVQKEEKRQIGVWFLKFCHVYELTNISRNPKEYSEFLSATYKK